MDDVDSKNVKINLDHYRISPLKCLIKNRDSDIQLIMTLTIIYSLFKFKFVFRYLKHPENLLFFTFLFPLCCELLL
jgi:hypothetical protein